jgi:hypothetical protein
MYPPSIAEQLRGRSHDVEAVTERPQLRALADIEVFAVAQRERRAVFTENIPDFSALADDHDRRGDPHHGLVLVDPSRFPRGNKRTVGHIVTTLGHLLGQHPGDEAESLRHWL